MVNFIPTDAKLRSSQNAWKPSVRKAKDEASAEARLGPSRMDWRSTTRQTSVDDEAAKAAEVVKKMRAIPNKHARVRKTHVDNVESLTALYCSYLCEGHR